MTRIAALVAIWVSVGFTLYGAAKPNIEGAKAQAIYRNARPGVAYVGSKVCAKCHADIYESFVQTDMGRSMSLPAQCPPLQALTKPVDVFDDRDNQYLEVYRSGSDFYQRIYALGPDGKRVFQHDERLTFVMGSGMNGYGFLLSRGSYLFEAPLSFYTSSQSWGLAPGYDKQNYGFSRPVIAECIFCHSGRPRPSETRAGLFKNPPFDELAIGCETCHGPGSLHVKEREAGAALAGSVDRSIVNPADLPGKLADSLCMRCHEGGDVQVLQPGKHYSDFFPGTLLDNTLAIFKVPLRRPTPPQSPLLSQYFSMILSKCYRASGGRLSCITCHDPHQEFTGQQQTDFYRARCLRCHTENSCKLPLETRRERSPSDDCIGCHMPRRTVIGISHAELTEHRILVRPNEAFPDEAYQATTNSPGLIDLTSNGKAVVPPLTLLQAYNRLLLEGHVEFAGRVSRLAESLAKTHPENIHVLSALGRQAMAEQTTHATASAIKYLSQSVNLGSTDLDDYLFLAELYAKSGEMPKAIAVLKRGIELSPYTREFYESLAASYIQAGQYGQALDVIRKGLALYPEDELLRMFMAKVKPALIEP